MHTPGAALIRRVGIALVAVLAIGAATGAAGWYWLGQQMRTPLALAQPTPLEVGRGATLRSVLEGLAANGALAHPAAVRTYARLTNTGHRIQAGRYTLQPGLTPTGLLEMLAAGTVDLASVQFIEGWTAAQAVAALFEHEDVDNDLAIGLVYRADGVPFLTAEAHAQVADLLGLEGGHIEGWLFPDTYAFAAGTTAGEILNIAHDKMRSELDAAWAAREPRDTLASPFELLTLASIVEKETSRADERAAIAGVFDRRLVRGMRLQTDPTVIYGVGQSYDGNIRRRDLEAENAYNTYRIDGLPPTPIALPGREALAAAAQPAEGDTLFFVATGEPDGTHTFSRTAEEHARAVQQYLRRRRTR